MIRHQDRAGWFWNSPRKSDRRVATAMSRRSAASSAAQQPQKARGRLRETVAEQLLPAGRWSAAPLGAPDVRFLVPNRFEYGYGLTPESVAVAAREVPDLLITRRAAVARFTRRCDL